LFNQSFHLLHVTYERRKAIKEEKKREKRNGRGERGGEMRERGEKEHLQRQHVRGRR